MVVAAERNWGTPKLVEFARYAKQTGAGVLMVMPPDWAGSCTTATLVDHYAAAAGELPVMIITATFVPRGEAFGLETLKRVRDEVPGVVAIKDDWCGEFGRKMSLLVHDQWAVFSGGQKQNHLNLHPFGCDGYLSTFITFKPQVSHDYWKAILAEDMAKAVEIIRNLRFAPVRVHYGAAGKLSTPGSTGCTSSTASAGAGEDLPTTASATPRWNS